LVQKYGRRKGNVDMSVRDLHRKPFDDGTTDKLDLYRGYLRAWLPTFIHSPQSVNTIQVIDFFAGPGKDVDGNLGSPLITCEEVRLALTNARTGKPPVINLVFNEYMPDKYQELVRCLEGIRPELPEATFHHSQMDFHVAFAQWLPLMQRPKTANLLFLDQNGVKQVTEDIFQTMASLPRTDFLFFLSSATANRFKDDPSIRASLPLRDEDFVHINGTNVHRRLTEAYYRWVPDGKRFFIAPFSIRKGANVYGLVFCSPHPRGMDKFLQLAWKQGGDANFDIDDDRIDPSAPFFPEFAEFEKPTKVKMFENALERAIKNRELKTNKAVYEFALRHGVLAEHARDALKRMVRDGLLPKQTFHVSYGAWEKVAAEPIRFC